MLERLVHCKSALTRPDKDLLRRDGDTLGKEEREDILSEVRDKLGVVAIVSKIVSSCFLQSLVSLRSTSLNFTKPRAKISLSTMLRSSSARLRYCKKV